MGSLKSQSSFIILLCTWFSQVALAQTSLELPAELNKFLQFSNQKTYKDIIHSYNDSAYSPNSGENKIEAVVLAPESRSAQKDKVSSKNPRIVYAQQNSKMFLAYAPDAKQVESIVWNPEKSKYEFYILENFSANGSGKNIKAIKQDDSKCTSCHQNGGPLWQRGGWSAYQTYWANGPSRQMKKVLKARKGKHIYEGFDLTQTFAGPTAPSVVDEYVRTAARKLQQGKVCNEVCGTDVDCKTELMLIALGKKKVSDEFIKKLVDQWPENGFGFPSSVLPDELVTPRGEHFISYATVAKKDFLKYSEANKTDPRMEGFWQNLNKIQYEMNPDTNGLYPAIYNEGSSSQGGGVGARGNPFLKEEFIKSKPGTASDPLFKRPMTLIIRKRFASDYLKKNLSSCFNFTDEEKKTLKAPDAEKIKLNPDLWGEKIRALFTTDQSIKNQNCADCSLPKIFVPAPAVQTPVANTLTLQSVYNKNDATQFFKKYCTECHAGTDGIKLLPLHQALKMKKNKSVREYIQHQDMPPKGAKSQPSEEERSSILEFLK